MLPHGMPAGPAHMQQPGPPHGYSPAGSAEGSPSHQAGYGQNPPGVGTQASGHVPPNQPMYSTQGYSQVGVGYPTISGSTTSTQAGSATMPSYQSVVTDGSAVPPPVNYPAAPNLQYSDQGPASMPPPPPQQMVQPGGMVPGQAYHSMQPGMEYQSFNMQSKSLFVWKV